jgi:hypothetical protein
VLPPYNVGMPVPPAPPPIEQLGRRPFSFYPAILNIEHNEWLYRRATWPEILVQNTNTQQEIWVPRQYWGAISLVEEPVMIVGLTKELEYREGAVWPAKRRVIEMPRAVNEGPRAMQPRSTDRPAAVIGIQLENNSRSRIGRLVVGGAALSLAACVLVVSLYRGGVVGNRIIYSPLMQTEISFTAADGYEAVVRAMGSPDVDQWRKSELQYRVLVYRRQGVEVILAGRTRVDARYVGALDRAWNPVHTVNGPVLRALPRF